MSVYADFRGDTIDLDDLSGLVSGPREHVDGHVCACLSRGGMFGRESELRNISNIEEVFYEIFIIFRYRHLISFLHLFTSLWHVSLQMIHFTFIFDRMNPHF